MLQIISNIKFILETPITFFIPYINSASTPEVIEYASIVPINEFSSGSIKLQGIIKLPLNNDMIMLKTINRFIYSSVLFVTLSII